MEGNGGLAVCYYLSRAGNLKEVHSKRVGQFMQLSPELKQLLEQHTADLNKCLTQLVVAHNRAAQQPALQATQQTALQDSPATGALTSSFSPHSQPAAVATAPPSDPAPDSSAATAEAPSQQPSRAVGTRVGGPQILQQSLVDVSDGAPSLTAEQTAALLVSSGQPAGAVHAMSSADQQQLLRRLAGGHPTGTFYAK